MLRSYALFGIAGSLVVGAALIEYMMTRPVMDRPVPPKIRRPVPAATPPSASAASAIEFGDTIRLRAALSNGYVLASGADALFVRIDLDAHNVKSRKRPPMALAIVIDRSGSMGGDKIENTKVAAKQLVDRLADSDRLSIISYATDYELNLALTEVGQAGRDRIHRIIDDLYVGGGTHLSAGLTAGLAQVASAHTPDLIRRVVLMSDGNANHGEVDPKILSEVAQRARLKGTTVTTLGVGVDFNEDLMTVLAEMGGGAYYYARDPEAIARALESEFQGLTALAALGIEVRFGLRPGVTIEEVYGYPTELRDGQLVVPVGDMSSGAHRQIMARLRVHPAAAGPVSISEIGLSYRGVDDRALNRGAGELSVVATQNADNVERGARSEVMEVVGRVKAAEARKEAAAHFSDGNREMAQRRLKRQLDQTRGMAKKLRSDDLRIQVRELENALRDVDRMNVSSDAGKDLVKREKHRARMLFAY